MPERADVIFRHRFPEDARAIVNLDNAASTPRPVTNKLQTRSAIAQACLRSSTFLARRFRRPLFPPTICTRAGQPDLVENAPNHCVDDGGEGWATVEGGNRGENNRASLKQSDDVAA